LQKVGPATNAVAIAFAANGVMIGAWAARIPDIKAQAGLDTAQLGFAMLGLGIGAVAAMMIAGRLAARYGSHLMTWLMLLLCAAVLPLIASATSFVSLVAILVTFGATQGSMDVCMNANGMAVERAGERKIMSRLHAFWSIGYFGGSIWTAASLWLHLSVLAQFTIMAVLMAMTSLALARTMLADRHSGGGPSFGIPPRVLLLLGLMAFCSMVAEGSSMDWSAVLVKDGLGGSALQAAMVVVVYSASMTVARLFGDRLTDSLGPVALVSGGALLAAVGLAIALGIGLPVPAILGYGLVGMGLAAVVPIVFRAGGSQPGIASGVGIAAVSTMSYSGGLLGPPVIGSVANVTGLRVALLIPLGMLLIVALMAPRLLGSSATAPTDENAVAAALPLEPPIG
jgi:MFS family permease